MKTNYHLIAVVTLVWGLVVGAVAWWALSAPPTIASR